MHLQLGAAHTEKGECNANTLNPLSLTVNRALQMVDFRRSCLKHSSHGENANVKAFVLLRSRVSVTMPLQVLDFRWRYFKLTSAMNNIQCNKNVAVISSFKTKNLSKQKSPK